MNIDVTFKGFGLRMPARIDPRHPSDPDGCDPELEPIEIVDYEALFEEIGNDNARWFSFVSWLQSTEIAEEFQWWVTDEFTEELLEEEPSDG